MLKNEVGFDAGDIYLLLSQRGRLSLRNIGEITNKKESSLFLSLGWLLRENKIFVFQHNGEWFFELRTSMNEIYY